MTTGGHPPPISAEVFVNVQRRGLSAEMIMTNTPAQGAAFHIEGYSNGISIRDYFAAAAMQGWLASYPDDNRHPVIAGNADEVAMNAYQMADAMLRAREAS